MTSPRSPAAKQTWLVRTAWFIWHWLPEAIVLAIAPVLLGVMSLVAGDHFHIGKHKLSWTLPLLAAAVVLLLPASIAVARRRGRFDRADRARRRAEARADAAERGLIVLMRDELEHLSEELSHFTNERLSLFRWEGDHFTLVARFSRGPTFDRSEGRPHYEQGQGCLWQAWLDHKTADPGLPPTPWDPAVPASREWLDAQRDRHRIPEPIARGFAMRSRSYAAVRIEGPSGSLGVVVAEGIASVDEAEASASVGGAHTRLDLSSVEAAVKLHSRRLARLLDEARVMDAATIVSQRRALQQESFGVFGSPR